MMLQIPKSSSFVSDQSIMYSIDGGIGAAVFFWRYIGQIYLLANNINSSINMCASNLCLTYNSMGCFFHPVWTHLFWFEINSAAFDSLQILFFYRDWAHLIRYSGIRHFCHPILSVLLHKQIFFLEWMMVLPIQVFNFDSASRMWKELQNTLCLRSAWVNRDRCWASGSIGTTPTTK